MSKRSIRLLGAPPPLTAYDQEEIAYEIARLRAMLLTVPGAVRVEVTANPSGLLGTYAWLLLEAAARGITLADLLPTEIRRQYGQQRWFTYAVGALHAFITQMRHPNGTAGHPRGKAGRRGEDHNYPHPGRD